jgi:single-strand DNA-binding protein
MAFDNNVVIVGNLTRDPELRFTQGGAAVCSFGVAWNQKAGPNGGEDKAHFFDVTCWRNLAENCAETLTKGARVVVYGRLDFSSWEDQSGGTRNKVQIVADEISPSLRWATAQVSRTERSGGDYGGGSMPASTPTPQAAPAYDPNEEPF